MAPVVLTLLQVVFLLLLYLFVWRVARAVVRDLRAAPAQPRVAAPVPAAAAPARSAAPARGAAPGGIVNRPTRGVPRELVVHVPDARPRVLRLDGGDITFGRSERSTVALTDKYASQEHARVYRQGEQWVVADLGSTNGTYLNKAKLTRPTPIGPGDQLGIGSTVVEVRK